MNSPTLTARSLGPSQIVIFGITGDLAQRKLLPALYHLVKDGLLHEQTEIIGISRRAISAPQLLARTELCVLETDNVCDPATIHKMTTMFRMHRMEVDDAAAYHTLRQQLDEREAAHGTCMNRLFYLSIPPSIYAPVVQHLGAAGLNRNCPHSSAGSRLLVEKPFGFDLASAHELIKTTAHHFKEEQVFRIDHYLAKETAQNILAFRFQNPLFQPLWDNHSVAHIDIVASEKLGVEGRAGFYDHTGALRDLIQSHLLQLLALTTMEQPRDMSSDAIHAARLALLEAVQPVPADEVNSRTRRGQYKGYRQEVENEASTTETYACVHLSIDNQRWHGVPITLRTGKALADKKTAITLTFRSERPGAHTNTLSFSIQPNEGISINLLVKKPGFSHELESAPMDFNYSRHFKASDHPDAYERVLVDALRGDRTLFASSHEVLTAWRIIEPVVQAWGASADSLKHYNKSTPIDEL